MNSNQKEVIIIAGANGSGKTTFAKMFLKSLKYNFLNADEIAKKLSPKDIKKYRLTAGRKFFKKIQTLINHEESFLIETTLAGKYIENIINLIKKKNYKVVIIFIFLESPEICINRIRERILKGEHLVPDEDVIRRYYRGKNNFWNKYRFMVDYWCLIENTSSKFDEISAGIKDEYVISNDVLFEIFLKGVNKE